MPPKVKISIPGPCHMRKDDMTEVKGGFHCNTCQKTVVDFSLLSDNEILNFFKKASGKDVCGFFREDQLNRELVIPEKQWPHLHIIKKMTASLLILQSFTESAFAQAKKKAAETTQTTEQIKPRSSRLVKGIVTDYISRTALAGVRITIQSHDFKLEIISDKKGHFSFDLPENMPIDSLLTISGTEKNNSGKKQTTTINTETIQLSTLLTKEILLYRYPFEILPMQEINTTRYEIPPLIDVKRLGGRSFVTTGTVTGDPVRHPNVWQRIKHLFHPKKSSR